MEVNKILEAKRAEKNLTLEEVAKQVGVSKTTIMRWESGDIANMKRDKIAKLAEVLGISPLVIMGLEDPEDSDTRPKKKQKLSLAEIRRIQKYRALDFYGKKAVDELLDTEYERMQSEKKEPLKLKEALDEARSTYTKEIPFPGKVSAGLGVSAIEDCDTTYGPDNADLALLIDGDSMEPLYHSGDMVYIKRQQIVESGQIAVVQVYNEYEDFIPKAYLKKVKINGENGTASLISLNDKYEEKIIPLNELTILGKVIGTN